jgi:hypothetical protein
MYYSSISFYQSYEDIFIQKQKKTQQNYVQKILLRRFLSIFPLKKRCLAWLGNASVHLLAAVVFAI